jgi:peroxiredoxin
MNGVEPGEGQRRRPWTMLIVVVVIGLVVADLIFLGLPAQLMPGDGQAVQQAAQPSASGFVASGVAVGQPAPDFTLNTLDGDQVSLTDFRGQPALINFWATWCSPCRLEMPGLVRAYETHKADGFVVLAINMTAQDMSADVNAFVEEFEMTFPVLLDESGEVADILHQLRGLPTSIFVDRDGRVARVQIGVMTDAQIDAFVAELVN